ncbi:amidohydrolase family protein [Nocardia sp. NPDC001965]
MQTNPQFLPPNLQPRPPSEPLPPGACDTHFHVFGPVDRYPYVEPRTYTPADAFLRHYLDVCHIVGIDRAVLVQPSVYGTDHRLLVDALNAHPDRLRGVAVAQTDVADRELERLHVAGVRGLRINPRYPNSVTLADLDAIAARLADLGWHIQVILDAEDIAEHAETLARLPVPVVIDHMGMLPAAGALASRAFAALQHLLTDAGAWVKLSAPYFISPDRPHHDDTIELMAALYSIAPSRTVWGSNWPHPGLAAPAPEEGDLLDLLSRAIPAAADLAAILVHNPARLYGFPKTLRKPTERI